MNESKRDYFAGMAMQALVTGWVEYFEKDVVAESAYEIADAMLMERKASLKRQFDNGSTRHDAGRSADVELGCKWAADQFQAIADFIADNSVARAQAHAQSCAAEMEAALSDVTRSK